MFSTAWVDDKGPQSTLGFVFRGLTRLLQYKGLVLIIDATFEGAPKVFFHF